MKQRLVAIAAALTWVLPAGEYEVAVDGRSAATLKGAQPTIVALPVGAAASSLVTIRRR